MSARRVHVQSDWRADFDFGITEFRVESGDGEVAWTTIIAQRKRLLEGFARMPLYGARLRLARLKAERIAHALNAARSQVA